MDSLDDTAADALDDVFLPPATTAEHRVNKFQPKPRAKPKKPAAAAVSKINPTNEDAEVSAVVELGDAAVGVLKTTAASNRSSSSCAPTDFSSQDSQAFERERNLQTDPYHANQKKRQCQCYCRQCRCSQAWNLMLISSCSPAILLQSNKQASFNQNLVYDQKNGRLSLLSFVLPKADETIEPEYVSQLKEKKAKSVSFSLPDGAVTAASPVGEHSEVLADNMARPERSFLHMMNDEVVDKILHSVSVTSDNVDVQLDHGNARSEDVADLSSVESFDSILLEPASVMGLNKATKMFFLVIAIVFCFFVSYHSLPKLTGKTVPKFRTKLSAKTKTAKANGSGNANDAEESTSSQWDSLPMDTEPLGDHDLCTTNLSSEQVDLVQMSSLEAGSPEG